MKHLSLKQTEHAGLYQLTIDVEGGANVFNRELIEEFQESKRKIDALDDIKALLIVSGKDDHFVFGADIKEIEQFKDKEEAKQGADVLRSIFNDQTTYSFPVICAVHGPCLGGGFELALACDYRIASDDAKTGFGLPEIQIGLIPGAGGSQRLPRLVGLQSALDMILTGKKVASKKAIKMGIVDAIGHRSQFIEIALQYMDKPKRKLGPLKEKSLSQKALEDYTLGRKIIRKKAKESVDKNAKGFYPAPYKAIDLVLDGIDLPLEKAFEKEGEVFGSLFETSVCKSLIHLFHATTHAKKNPFEKAEKEKFKDQKDYEVESIGVVGAGLMGSGIANVCADRGYRVRLTDPSDQSISKALKSADQFFGKKVARKKIKEFEKEKRMHLLSVCNDATGMQRSDVIIEAVFEDMGLKRKILASFEKQAQVEQVFATNTSALPIADIAAEAKHKERVIGMHFFSPVEKMPLLEVVKTKETADWVTSRAVRIGQKLGKQVIVVEDGPGFYTTRILALFLNEAAVMLQEGIAADKLDRCFTQFGFPVGPITLLDEVGIDVSMHVIDTIAKHFPKRVVKMDGMKEMVDEGNLGRKAGKGFFLYQEGKKTGLNTALIQKLTKGDKNRLSDAVILDRSLLQFVNESVRCLEEKIIAHPHDGDVGAVFGLGFPPFWGGPFKYVDHIGADKIVERLQSLEAEYGERFSPCDLLQKHAKQNELFFPTERN